jgi:NhaC family Na+:H+ antiporter
MEIYIGLLLSLFLIMYAVFNSIFIGYMLIVCWIIFLLISLRKGFKLNEILNMSFTGGKKSFVVLKVFLLIGAVIGVWMASGTIQTLVYYSIKYISPSLFVLFTFLICCITSFLIGTSLGTVSIVGIPLMILAQSGNVNVNIIAGAIISGAYFGDRCSPMSSSAALVANLTKTNLFINIKNMMYSSLVPFLLSIVFYYILSIFHPLQIINDNLSKEIMGSFIISPILLIPAAIILILSLCKINLKTSISISILVAIVLAIVFQRYQVEEVLQYMFFGFKLNNNSPLSNIIKGGGVVSMLKVCLVVYVSCSLAGIFEGIKMFDKLKSYLIKRSLTGSRLFGVTAMVSTLTAAFGCNQSIAMVMTNEIMKDCYAGNYKYKFAMHLENSGILISALIPWNLAALVPTTTLNISATGYLPYAFYLYILPMVYLIYCKYWDKPKPLKCEEKKYVL